MGILFTLRPDANLRRDGDATTLPTEYDTRSGNVVTATPSLRLLDLYELTFIDTAAFQFGYGVYENVYGDSIFYSEELEFGLRPRFPRKYAGLRLTWRSSPTGADTNLESSYSKYEITISTIEASNDRHEKFTSSSKSDDAAPSSQDAYIGGAFQLVPTKPLFPRITLWLFGSESGFWQEESADGRSRDANGISYWKIPNHLKL